MKNYRFRLSENTSVSLDLIRAFSAQLVVVGHGIWFMGILTFLHYPKVPWIQSIGVVIFFILSGLLITYSTFFKMNNKEYSFRTYFIERFSRIYSGYLPVIILIIGLDAFYFYYLGVNDTNNSFNILTFIGNLFMLQDFPLLRYQSFINITSFGTARPFWTIAIEWWIYLFFGWMFLGRRVIKNRYIYLIILLVLAIVPLQQSMLLSSRSGLAFVWIFGFVIAVILNTKLQRRFKNLSPLLSFILFLMACARVYGTKNPYDIPFALLLASSLYFFIVFVNQTEFKIPEVIIKIIRKWSGYSMTLYLLHYSILAIIATQKTSYSPYFLFILGFIISNLLAFVIAYFTEMKYKKFREYLLFIFRNSNIIKNLSELKSQIVTEENK